MNFRDHINDNTNTLYKNHYQINKPFHMHDHPYPKLSPGSTDGWVTDDTIRLKCKRSVRSRQYAQIATTSEFQPVSQ